MRHSAILGEWMLSGTYVRGGILNVMGKNPQSGKVESLTIPFPATAIGSHGGTTISVTIAIPERKDVPYRVENFEILLDGKPLGYQPEVFLDNTKNLVKNLEDERSVTLARTAVRVLTRTIAAQTAKKKMETNNVLLNLVTSIGTDVAAAQLEQADLRRAVPSARSPHGADSGDSGNSQGDRSRDKPERRRCQALRIYGECQARQKGAGHRACDSLENFSMQTEEIKARFDAIAKVYDENRKKFIPCFDDYYLTTVRFLSSSISSPKTILDLGGNGTAFKVSV